MGRQKRPDCVDPAVTAFLTKLAKARGYTNITVTERLDKPGDPVIIDHDAGLFYELGLRKTAIACSKT